MPRRRRWTREEVIVTLDFYMKNWEAGIPAKKSQEIENLATKLYELAPLHDLPVGAETRSVSSIYARLMNFHHINPDWAGNGLPHVAQLDREVWKEFAGKPEVLNAKSKAIILEVTKE